MKIRVVIAFIVVLLLIGFGITEEIYVTKVFDEYTEKLDSINIEKPLTTDQILELKDWWLKKHKTLEIILPHNNLNEITYIYGEMIGAIEIEDDKSAKAQFFRLQTTVEAISEMYGFRLGNIF